MLVIVRFPPIPILQADPPASINYDLWGCLGTDWAWSRYGSYFTDTHINLLADSNSTLLMMIVSIQAWDTNDDENVLGIDYQDYLAQMVDWCHQADPYISVVIFMHSIADSYDAAERYDIMRNVDGKGDVWLDRCQDIIGYIAPDGMCVMDEAFSYSSMLSLGVTQAEWRSWCVTCLTTFREINASIQFWTYPLPYTGFYRDGGLQDNPLEDDGYTNIVYFTDMAYYDGNGHTYQGYNIENLYHTADSAEELAEAKAIFYDYLDSRYDDLLDTYQCCLATAVASHDDESEHLNWEEWLTDSFDYCTTHNLYCLMYAFSKNRWTAMNGDKTDWNQYGQHFVDSVPLFGQSADTTAPTLESIVGNPRHNATEKNTTCMFSASVEDNYGLSGYIFGTNNTGVWANETFAALSTNPDWANATKTLNTTQGILVQYRWWVNDTSNNWFDTGLYNLTTTGSGGDSTSPMYSNIAYNSTTVSTINYVSIQWEDETDLSHSVFGTNNTGTWVNQTTTLSSNPAWHNVTFTVNSTVNIRVEFQYYANDTSDNWASSDLFFFTTNEGVDVSIPDVYVSHTTAAAGAYVTFSCDAEDNYGLHSYIFGTNVTGSWVNETATRFTLVNNDPPETDSVANYAYLPLTVGTVVQYQYWVNDTSGNWASTSTESLTTTSPDLPDNPLHILSDTVTLTANTQFRTRATNTTFVISNSLDVVQAAIDHQYLWLSKSYTRKYYTPYCLYVTSPNDVSLNILRWFTASTSSGQLTINTPLETAIYLSFYSPNLVTAYATGVVSSTWNSTTKTLTMVCNSNVNPITIFATATETEVNVTPENVAVSITDVEGCGAWVFSETEYYTFQARYWDGDGYGDIEQAKLAFSDGSHWINVTYDADDGYSIDSGEDYIRLQAGTATSIDSNMLQVTFLIYFQNTILDALNVDIYMYCIDDYGAYDDWQLMEANYFSIYNLGGHAEILTIVGSAGRLVGGDVFDLYAENASAIAVGMSFRNLQHIKLCPQLNCTLNTVPYNILYFFDYCTTDDLGDYSTGEPVEGDWVRGWGVVLSPYSYLYGSKQYIKMNVRWYNRGEQIGDTKQICWYHQGTAADNPTFYRFWIDLWFNRVNASTTVGGRVSAYNYPMNDNSAWFLQWLSGHDWGIEQNVTFQSMFFDTLQNVNNETISTSQIKMIRVRHGLIIGSDDPNLQNVTISEYDIFDLTFGSDPLEGIQTPVFDPPVIPVMPQGGFLGTLWSSLRWLGDQFNIGFGAGLLDLWNVFVAFMDTIFATFGMPNGFTQLMAYVNLIGSWLQQGATFLLSFLGVVLIVVATTFGYVYNWFSMLISTLTSMVTGLQFIWDLLYPYWSWVPEVIWVLAPLITVFYVLWVLDPFLNDMNDFHTTKQRLTDTLGLFVKVINYIWKILEYLINLLMHLIEKIPIVE